MRSLIILLLLFIYPTTAYAGGAVCAWSYTPIVRFMTQRNAPEYAVLHINKILEQYNKDMRGWPETIYTEGVPTVHYVHTGVIVSELLKFYIIYNDVEEYKDICKKVLSICEEAISICDSLPPADVAWNERTAMGMAYIYLYIITGRGTYIDNADIIASQFYDSWNFTDDNCVWWPYSQKEPLVADDWSHVYISCEFVSLCVNTGVVFSIEDEFKILNTVKKYYSDKSALSQMDGTGSVINWPVTHDYRQRVLDAMK